MPPPGGPRSPFQCLLDASQARIQSGVRCQQRRDLFLLSLDLLLLLFDGVVSTTFKRSYLTPSISPLSLCVTSKGSTFATSSAPSPKSRDPFAFQVKLIGASD